MTHRPGLSIRVGIGVTSFDFEADFEPVPECWLCGIDLGAPNLDLTVPFSVQYLFNLNGHNYLETGMGYAWQVPEKKYDEKSIHPVHGSIGFRRHFGKNKTWMWKVNFTPLIGAGRDIEDRNSEPWAWAGVSIGKRFGQK